MRANRPNNPQMLPAQFYSRAAKGAPLPLFNQSLYARIAAQRAAFLKSQPSTFYDPGLNPLVAERIQRESGIDDSDWRSFAQGTGAIIGTGIGAKVGWGAGTAIGGFLTGAKVGATAGAAGGAVGLTAGMIVGGVVGTIIGAISGAHTGAAAGGLISHTGLVATGELIRNVLIGIKKDPIPGAVTATVSVGTQLLAAKFLPGGGHMARMAIGGASSRVIMAGYTGFSDLIVKQKQLEPNDPSTISSLGAVANTLDNFSGATTVKAMLTQATGDEEDFMTVLSKAYGWHEDGFTQLDFSRVRRNAIGDGLGTFGNAAIDFVGEMLVDPGIWYPQVRAAMEKDIFKRTKSVLSAEQLAENAAEIAANSPWGKFAKALDNNGFHRMSKVISEHIFERAKSGKVLSKLVKKKDGNSFKLFRDQIIEMSVDNPGVLNLILEAKAQGIKIDDFLRPIYNEMIDKVVNNVDSGVIAKSLLAQESTSEVKSVYDALMLDKSIKNKGDLIDSAIYADLKKYNVDIGLNDFQNIKRAYPRIRLYDEFDNIVGMSTMTLLNPLMAGARLGSSKLQRYLSKGNGDRTINKKKLIEIDDENNIALTGAFDEYKKSIVKKRQELNEQKKEAVKKIKERNREKYTKEIEALDKEIATLETEYKQRSKDYTEYRAKFTIMMYDEHGLSKDYGAYNEDSIKNLKEKMKTMDKDSPEYKQAKETVQEYTNVKNLIEIHMTEIEAVDELLHELKTIGAQHKVLKDIFTKTHTTRKPFRVTKSGSGYDEQSLAYKKDFQRAFTEFLKDEGFYDTLVQTNNYIYKSMADMDDLQRSNKLSSNVLTNLKESINNNPIYNLMRGNSVLLYELNINLKSKQDELAREKLLEKYSDPKVPSDDSKIKALGVEIKEIEEIINEVRNNSAKYNKVSAFSTEDQDNFISANQSWESNKPKMENSLIRYQGTEKQINFREDLRRFEGVSLNMVFNALNIPTEHKGILVDILRGNVPGEMTYFQKDDFLTDSEKTAKLKEGVVKHITPDLEKMNADLIKANKKSQKKISTLEAKLTELTYRLTGDAITDEPILRDMDVLKANIETHENNILDNDSKMDINREKAFQPTADKISKEYLDGKPFTVHEMDLIIENIENIKRYFQAAQSKKANRELHSEKSTDNEGLEQLYRALEVTDTGYSIDEVMRIIEDTSIIPISTTTDGGKKTITRSLSSTYDSLNYKVRRYFVTNDIYMFNPSDDNVSHNVEKVTLLDYLESRANNSQDRQIIAQARELFEDSGTDLLSTTNKRVMNKLVTLNKRLRAQDYKLQLNKNKVMWDTINDPTFKESYDLILQLYNAFSGLGNRYDYDKNSGLAEIFSRAAGGAFDGNRQVTQMKQNLSNVINTVDLLTELVNDLDFIERKHAPIKSLLGDTNILTASNQVMDLLKRSNLEGLLRLDTDGNYIKTQEEYDDAVTDMFKRFGEKKSAYDTNVLNLVEKRIKELYNNEKYKGYSYKDYGQEMVNDSISIITEVQHLLRFSELNTNESMSRSDSDKIRSVDGSTEKTRPDINMDDSVKSLDHILDRLKTDSRELINRQKHNNNKLSKLVFSSNSIKKLMAHGINMSELGKNGSMITLAAPAVQSREAHIKKIYSSAFFTEREPIISAETGKPEINFGKGLQTYGVNKDNASDAIVHIMSSYENVFGGQKGFMKFASWMAKGREYGFNTNETQMGKFLFDKYIQTDVFDLYQTMARYNTDITIDQIKTTMGLALYHSDFSREYSQFTTVERRADYRAEFNKYKKDFETQGKAFEDVKRTYKYTEESKAVSTLINGSSLLTLKEDAKDLGITLSDELEARIKDYRDPTSNKESELLLKEDIFKEVIRAKYGEEAFETVTVKDNLTKKIYSLKVNDPAEVNVNIPLGNTTITFAKTGIQASSFPNHQRILFFDSETTGLDPKTDSIVEYGSGIAEIIDGEFVVTKRLDMLTKLKRVLSNETTAITGITIADLEKNGIDEKQLAHEVYESMKDEGTLIAAYNAQFDIGFINELLMKHIPGFTGLQNDILDPMTMYQDNQYGTAKLKVAGERYGAEGVNTHRASDDASYGMSLISKMIGTGVNPTPYINRFGYNKKYYDQLKKLPGIEYIEQDQHAPVESEGTPINKVIRVPQLSTAEPLHRSKAVQTSKTKRQFVDGAALEIEKYIELHGEETFEQLVDAYDFGKIQNDINKLKEKRNKIYETMALNKEADLEKDRFDTGYTKENPATENVRDHLVERLVETDEKGFKSTLTDYLTMLNANRPLDEQIEIEKVVDNLYEMYKSIVLDQEQIDKELELFNHTSRLVYNDVTNRYEKQRYGEYDEYDGQKFEQREKKLYQDMTPEEIENFRRGMIKQYLERNITYELGTYEERGEWIPGNDAVIKEFDEKYGQLNMIDQMYDGMAKDVVISKLDNLYGMTFDNLQMFFKDPVTQQVDTNAMFEFLVDNQTYKLVVTELTDHKRVRSAENLDREPINEYDEKLLEAQKKRFDPDTGVETLDTYNPTVKEYLFKNADDLKTLIERGEGKQIGLMSVENFKRARRSTMESYKLPPVLDFYYRNILRLQKKDMLMRLSFHPRNFIDVIRKNSTIMDGIWDVPQYIQMGAQAYKLYNQWDGYQKDIVTGMNQIHKLYAKGATDVEIDGIRQTLDSRMDYLEKQILAGKDNLSKQGKYQLKRDQQQYESVKKLKENFDTLPQREALKALYYDYDKIGFGAYVRQHHVKGYTVADYQSGSIELDKNDLDTYVYLKLRKQKSFKNASASEQEVMLQESIQDQIKLLDMTNSFEKTSATTDVHAFMKRLNKDKIEGERLPVGDRVFQTLATDNLISKGYFAIGTQIEQVGRLHGYMLDRHLHGVEHDEAIARSLKRHYDYSDQTPAETWATLIFPFHAFPTRNAMFWSGMFQDASQIRTMHNLITAVWGSVDEEDKKTPYIQNAMVSGYVPVGNTLVKVGDSRGGAMGLLLNPYREMTNRMNPLIRESINQLSGKGNTGVDLLRNVPIARLIPEGISAMKNIKAGKPVLTSLAPGLFGNMFRGDTQPYFDKYRNIYKNLYTAKGKRRTPSHDSYYRVRSIMYDMERRKYT